MLPNNKNVVLSAEQAVGLASKPVRVIPSMSVPAGLAAIVRYMPTAGADENEAAMREALEQVATGEVTIASRDMTVDGVEVRSGSWLGLAQGHVVACAEDFDTVATAVIERLLADGERGLLTVLTGEDEPDVTRLVEELGSGTPVEVEVHPGGQPHYPLLIAAE